MKVEVTTVNSSKAHVYDNAINSYTKDLMFCVLFEKGGKRVVHKYPLVNIFRVVEPYGLSER